MSESSKPQVCGRCETADCQSQIAPTGDLRGIEITLADIACSLRHLTLPCTCQDVYRDAKYCVRHP